MAFLIVDPDLKSREAAATMVTWVDRRHRVDFADDGASALTVAIRRRPRIVFIEPTLPDISSEQLCAQLRKRLPRLTCVALSNSDSPLPGFDNQLRKPPSRLEVLAVIEQAKQNVSRLKTREPESAEPKASYNSSIVLGPTQTIYLSLFDEALKFGVPVPVGAKLADVLQQIGKATVRSCSLIRNGKDLGNHSELPIRERDHLVLHL